MSKLVQWANGGQATSNHFVSNCLLFKNQKNLHVFQRAGRLTYRRVRPSETREARIRVQASFQAPTILPATSHWGVFGFLSLAGAIGLWSAENTRIGRELSGPMVATLVGIALSNLGAIPCNNPVVYGVINKYMLPLAIPMLLFTADLRRMLFDTGRMLLIFVVGSVATLVGTLVAFKLLPLASLGSDSWKVAAALCARHIGGAVNYVGVAETLGVTSSAQASGLAADNLLCAVYFGYIFHLARNSPADVESSADSNSGEVKPAQPANVMTVNEGAISLAISAIICYLGTQVAAAFGVPDAGIPVITLLSVLLATLIPRQLESLVSSGEAIASILLSIFFAAVGANGNIRNVIFSAPALFLFCLIQIGVHLSLILGAGKLLGFSRRDILVASNANVGGPTTAAGMCAAKGWKSSVVPALLVGTFGYAIATFLGVAIGVGPLKSMAV